MLIVYCTGFASFPLCLAVAINKIAVQCSPASKVTKSPFWENAQKTDTKVWMVQNVHKSVSCTVVFMKRVQSGSSCTIVWHFVHHIIWAERKIKTHPWHYDIFSVLSVRVCRTRPTKIHMPVVQLHKKWRFHDTPVQLVQNVHWFASCLNKPSCYTPRHTVWA